MRHLFGCPDIVSLTEKFLMARNFYRIFTEKSRYGGQQNLWYSRSEGVKKLLFLKIKLVVYHPTQELTNLYPFPMKNS